MERFKHFCTSLLKVVPAAALLWTCTGDSDGPTAPELTEIGGPVRESTGTLTLTPLVLDGFTRTVAEGWGTADVGGPWRITAGQAPDFQVNGSEGLIVKGDTHARNAVATEGYGLDVAGLTSFSIDTPPDNPGRFITVQVYSRRDDTSTDGDNYYRFRVQIYGNGKMVVRVEKNVAGQSTWLHEGRRIDYSWAPGQRYWIRWETMGVSPSTAVRMRVWRDGEPEPASWDVDLTVDEPALDVPGTTGMRVEGPNGKEQVTFPITFSFDDLEYGTPAVEPAPNEAPVASPGGPYSGTAGVEVQFDGSASADPDGDTPLTYAWSFGDGATGTGERPVHTYAAADTYTVTLTVTDTTGLSGTPASTTAEIVAAPSQAPTADPGGPYSGTAGVEVQFDGSGSTDPGGDTLSYAWTFGDGASGTGERPVHTYAVADTYTVTLTVTSTSGQSSTPESTTAEIVAAQNQAPVADAGGPYTGTVGSAVQFDGSGSSDPDGDTPLSYAWTFGDGATGTGAAPTHTYAAAGTYTVTLTVTDARGAVSDPNSTTAAIEAESTSGALVQDAFGRSVTGGWGAPDVGGSWKLNVASDFQVDGSRGLIVKNDNGPRNAVATEGYGLDVTGKVSFSIETPIDNSSRYYTVEVYARRNDLQGDGANYYSYRVRAFGNGSMDVRLEKKVAGTGSWLVSNQAIASTWVPGQRYWIRWECVGTSPSTTLRMRVWRDGDPEPTGWDTQATVDEPRLDVSGTTGLRGEGPNGSEQVTFPITFSFDDLDYSGWD